MSVPLRDFDKCLDVHLIFRELILSKTWDVPGKGEGGRLSIV